MTARVCLGLRECPLPASGACRRYQGCPTLLLEPTRTQVAVDGVENVDNPAHEDARRHGAVRRGRDLVPGDGRPRRGRRATRRTSRRPGRDPRLPPLAHRPRRLPCRRPLRPGRRRPQHPLSRPRRRVLDARPLRPRAPESRRGARDCRSPPRSRPVVGRLPRRRSTRSPSRPACDRSSSRTPPRRGPTSRPRPNKLREQLPQDVQATLTKHEEAGSYDDPEYVEACLVFYARHVCRIPWPPEVARSFEYLDEDPTVYRTMNGPSEFHIIGSCKDWQVKDRLHEIRVPTLLVSGRHDEATPALQQVLLDGIAGSEWVVLRGVVPHAARRGARALHAGRGRLARAARLAGAVYPPARELSPAEPASRSLAEGRRLGRHARRGDRVRARLPGEGREALSDPDLLDGAHAPLRPPRRRLPRRR